MYKWVLENQLVLEEYKNSQFKFQSNNPACKENWLIKLSKLYSTHFTIEILSDDLDRTVLVQVKITEDIVTPHLKETTVYSEIFNPQEKKCFTFVYQHKRKPNPGKIKIKFYAPVDTLCDVEEKEIKVETTEENCDTTDNLVDNLIQLLGENTFSDIKIHCGSEIFKAHKAILSCRSPVFAAMLRSPMKEALTGELEITVMKPEVLHVVLKYIYSGRYSYGDDSADKICDVLAAADKYLLHGLKEICAEALRNIVSETNALCLLVVADLHDPKLKNFLLHFICVNYSKLKNSSGWKKIQSDNKTLMIDIMNAKIEYSERY